MKKMGKTSFYGKSATKMALSELFNTTEPYEKDTDAGQNAASSSPVRKEEPGTQAQELNTTVIAEDTVVDGTICTSGHVECKGMMNGDISAGGIVTLSGELIGNIQGETVTFLKATVKGNIVAQKRVDVDRDTQIDGDIQADNVALNGRVTGSIMAKGQVSLQKNARLQGDIKASAVSMEAGAHHCGKVEMETRREEAVKKEEPAPQAPPQEAQNDLYSWQAPQAVPADEPAEPPVQETIELTL